MKQKTTKLLVSSLLVSMFSLAGLAVAAQTADNFLPVGQLSSMNSCRTEAKIYLDEDNDADTIPDYFLYLRSNFRLFDNNPGAAYAGQILQYTDPNNANNTKVFYYASNPNVLTKKDASSTTFDPLNNQTFKRASRVFPFNQRVRGIDTNNTKIIFERPLITGSNTTVSIIYRYKYYYAYDYLNNNTSPYRYNPVASGGDYHGLTLADYVDRTSKKRRWVDDLRTLEYCKNYLLHRCGDGVIDTTGAGWVNTTFTGEICDDGPLNGTPGHCNATCSGMGGGTERCGDEILQPAGTFYNGDPNNMSYEECDDGDALGDTNGVLNGDDPATAFCSTICLPTFSEVFTEEFVNG